MLQIFRNLRLVPLTRRSVVNIRWYSDEDSSDDEKKKIKDHKKQPNASKQKSDEAVKRLNELLNLMSSPVKTSINANIITAKNKRQEGKEKKEKEIKEKLDDPKNLEQVTRKIAEKIGGDVEKTESELLSSLLGFTGSQKSGNLNDLIGGLTVERDGQKEISRAQMVRNALPKSSSGRPPRSDRSYGERAPRSFDRRPAKETFAVNLFGGEPLNIFEKASTATDPCATWSRLEKRDLKLAVTHPPRNYFEKMALWTEQGKIWKFPIDNEQGWDEEHQTDFTEHVMLEQHLEGWCPSRGPIRHFMELVCVGLSKNNFLSAKEKRDHVLWYKGYFEEKKALLGNLLTLNEEENPQKQVEA